MLPNLNMPEFSLELPSSGETIFYRPFLVKEEKMLLMALEGDKKEEIDNILIQVLKNCVVYDGDIEELPFVDLEYIFVNLRAKSIDNIINLKVKHQNNSECTHSTDYQINLNDVTVEDMNKDRKVMLTDNVGTMMKYPTLKATSFLSNQSSTIDNIFLSVAACIDYIFDSDDVYENAPIEEKISFVENLNKTQFEKIMKFMQSIPTVSYTIKYTCQACNKDEEIKLKGIQNFFV